MTRSMTAFARHQSEHTWGTLIWEIRSVNHRYLEPAFRLPESFRELEGALRETLRNRLARGKVECTLRYQPSEENLRLEVDLDQVVRIKEVLVAVNKVLRTDEVDPLALLQWPGVMKVAEADQKVMNQAALESFDQALSELIAGREREGAALADLIGQRLDAVDAVVESVRKRLPEILQAQRDNLKARLEELKTELDPARLEQEIVLLAQKADVDEELDRLQTHVNEVRRVLRQREPVGRRLDFLMQELNREANTLSSKSIVAETTRSAVELKVLIEQMREQIQNIE